MHSLRYNVHFGLTNRQGTQDIFAKSFQFSISTIFCYPKLGKKFLLQEVLVGKIVVKV